MLNEICASGDADGGVYGDDEEQANQGTFAPEASAADSSSVPSLPAAAAAAAEKELWTNARALGLHSSIHLAVAIARNFSRHKRSGQQGSAATSIAEGCLARVKVEC